MELDKLYQNALLEYSSRKEFKYEIESPDYVERGHNSSCGDDLTLMLKIENNIIIDASYIGSGCAVSSASMAMLIELIKGKKLNEVIEMNEDFFNLMNHEELDENKIDKLDIANILVSFADMPARVKCATMPWHTLKVIIEKTKVVE